MGHCWPVPTTIPDTHRDLLDATIATLATIAPDGRPQLSPVWFLYDAGAFRLALNTNRRKVRNLLDRPACGLLVLDLANPVRYLEIRGDAEVAPDDDFVFADRLGAKYGADVRARTGADEHRVAVTIRATRVNAVDLRS